jgi:ribosomal protein S18 acetylase RimI-like enzyme
MFKQNSPIIKDTSKESMIHSIENNLAAYPFFLSRLPNSVLHDDPDLLWIESGVPIFFYNGVFKCNLPSGDIHHVINEVIQKFRKRNLSFIWQIGPSSRPADLCEQLIASGFKHDESEPGMALDLQSFKEEDSIQHSDFIIKKVVNDKMLNEWVRVWVFGAPEYISLTQKIHLQLGYRGNLPWKYYLGYLNDKPVATVMLFLAKGVAAIHYVVTLPEARNQGIGTAMTTFALKEAKRAGYRIAILTASDEGINIYKRLGFQEYCTISKYVFHVKVKD